MIDLHTHTLFSDGVLLPSELARRAESKGYSVIGITDHVDFSNLESVIPSLLKVSEEINRRPGIKMIPGVEITHVHPESINEVVLHARRLGARLIVVHGETIVEPVAGGTNRAAIEAGVDILAHPGLLSEDEARLAADKGVHIEISARPGHSFGNGRVVKLWYKYRFPMVLDTDTHTPKDLINDEFAETVIMASGVEEADVKEVISNSRKLADTLMP